MRAKRQRDRKAVASFQQRRQERQEGPVDPAPKRELPQKEEEEEDMVETVEVRAAGAAGAGDTQLGPRSPRDRQWCSPISPYSLWKWGTFSAYSLHEGGVETKAGGQPQVQGQPKLQSGSLGSPTSCFSRSS